MEDEDQYVEQLREVFDSCDVEMKGFLKKQGLIELCQKLQLEDQVPKLLAQLLGNQEDGEVNFEDFKEGFVIVLSDAIDGLTVSSGEEPVLEIEEPPKMVVNDKRYGRRSRPFDSKYSDTNASADDGDVESISGSRPSSPDMKPTLEKHPRIENGENVEQKIISKERRLSRANSQKLRKRESLRKRDSIRRQDSMRKRSSVHTTKEEILEASGQISSGSNKWIPHQSIENSGLTSPTEEEQLKQIWSEVNVGANGFLDKNELSVVCEHIGMEGIDEDELSLLFDELDDDNDGQVSFEEFLHGLFLARDKSQESDPLSHSDGLLNGLESPRGPRPGSKTPAEQPMTTLRTIEGSLFQMLDPENTGLAKLEDIRDMWQAQDNTEALHLLKHAEVDSEGKVSLSQLTAVLESVIYEKSDAICQAVVSMFKTELTYMRNQVESCNVEKEKLLENASNLVNEKSVLIQESEENTRQLEHQYELKLKQHEETFNEKLQQAQQRTAADHEKAIATFSKKVLELEREIEHYKAEEVRVKQEIAEREDEIERLDSTLNETQETLEESERVRSRLEKEVEKSAGLSKKLAEVVSERDFLKQQQSQHASKGIRELEQINRQLRDENDELKSEVELLKSQAKSNVKRNRSHRRRTTDRISRVGSVLSDYTKPVIIKRNKDGLTSSDESEHDIIDGKPAIVRVSGDGGSNEDEQKAAAVNSEQKKTIEELTSKLSESEVKMKELEQTIRLQEQNIKAKDGSINKQKISLEKLRNEVKDMTADLDGKFEVIEQLQSNLKTREKQQQQYEDEIKQLGKNHEINKLDHETKIRNLKSEIESLQRVNNSENSELKERFNKELGNLTSQFTTEIEELQQRFGLEKEELEIGFQEKYKTLEDEYHGTLETITELKSSFKKEKELILNETKAAREEIEAEFLKKKEILEQLHKQEVENVQKKHSEELKSFENVASVLRDEKKQLEGFFEKEKVEISQQFAAEKAEIEQERNEIEMRLSAELEREKQRFVNEKTNSASDYQEFKNALNEKFIRDKTNLETNFAREKLQLEETVEELRQIFINGKTGLKGKLKEDFEHLVSEHQTLLDNQNARNEEEMKMLREKEVDLVEMLTEKDKLIEILREQVTILNNESSQLKELQQADRDDITDLEKTRHEIEELHLDLLNRHNEKIMLSEKSRKDLYLLECTVEEMAKERKKLENSLCQQNIKNTSLQDEITHLKGRNVNLENRFKTELEAEKQKLNLAHAEMSTAKSKYTREVAELREKLERALSIRERDQATKDKILSDAKIEILTLSKKLEEKAKQCRDLQNENQVWEERVRMLDRQRREMELRVKKTNESVDDHVSQLSKQLEESRERSIRTDTLVQELYIENAQLTKSLQQTEAAQKKAEKSNRQLVEQKRALQRVISKLCGANALA